MLESVLMRNNGTSAPGPSKLQLPATDHFLAVAHLAAIVGSADDAIISKNLEGVIQSWNAGAERIFGYTPEEAVGQTMYLIIPEDRHPEEEMILARLRRGEMVDHFETLRQRKDGSLVPVSVT